MHPNIHCNNIDNSNQIFIDRRMDKEDVVLILYIQSNVIQP